MLGDAPDVGNISVSFYAMYDQDGKPPLNEGASHVASHRLGMTAGTRRHEDSSIESRKVGALRVKISVFYSDQYPE
jgi:hypothetical protein